MSCNCHGTGPRPGDGVMSVYSVLPPMMMGMPDKKKPCGPCAQMAAQIASTIPVEQGGTLAGAGLGVATNDDLFTIQAFLQSLTNGVSPTEPALSQAQTAADNLSVTLAVRDAVAPPGTMTVRTVSIGLMIAGALAAGAGAAYLLHNPRQR